MLVQFGHDVAHGYVEQETGTQAQQNAHGELFFAANGKGQDCHNKCGERTQNIDEQYLTPL